MYSLSSVFDVILTQDVWTKVEIERERERELQWTGGDGEREGESEVGRWVGSLVIN